MQRNYVTIRPLNREDSVLYFPPEAFGPFRVLHQIGAGALGPVFRAYEPADDRRDRLVAVKVFRLDLTPEQAAALVAELDALVAAHLSHPNIAAPIAAGLEHGAAYLAQEYAVGDSLDVVLRERGPMPIRDVVALVGALAGAIDHAAERGVSHGLLHPRDIIVAADAGHPNARHPDAGAASGAPAAAALGSHARLPRVGARLGAPAVRVTGFGIAPALANVGAKLPTRSQYASPNAASDIYSLGAIAFEAATGKRVSEDNLKEFDAQHGSALRAAFDRALATDAASRPSCASDFADALKAGLKASTTNEVDVVPTFRSAPAAPIEPQEPHEPDVDPLDREIDLGAPPVFELDEPPSPPLPPPVFPSSWSAQPPRALQTSAGEPPPSRSATARQADAPSRRWPIVAMFLLFAVLAALSVGFFLRSPRPAPVADKEPGVDETIVDLPASPSAQPPPVASAVAPTSPSAVADKSADKPRVAPGRLLIRSTPADADVFVNGKLSGRTPLALRDLALGSYTIRVARNGYVADERTLQLTARQPATSTTIDLRPAFAAKAATVGKSQKTGPGTLNVQSRPAGARVYVNGRLAGTTPIAIPDLPAGPATVRIEMDGYRLWATKVQVNAGEQTRVAASLERR